MAMTHDRADSAQRAIIKELFGKADLSLAEVETLRAIIVDTGAQAAVEELISSLTDEACAAIDNPLISSTAQELLHQMATIATKRNV